jgi:hypothetical protein
MMKEREHLWAALALLMAFRFYSISAFEQHSTAEVCVVLDNIFFEHSLAICRRQRAFSPK